MIAIQQPDISSLIDTLEEEWREAEESLATIDVGDDEESLQFFADWPLLVDWWDRIYQRRDTDPLSAAQQARVDAVAVIIRRNLTKIREIVGDGMAMIDGIT